MTYPQLLKALAARLKRLRKREGWTQQDMWTKHGFNYRWYQRVESGKHSPSLQSLHDLAGIFGVSVRDLLK